MDNSVATPGVSAARMLELSGATYRQLDHWSRGGRILRPYQHATGAGHPRRWSEEEAGVARCIAGLVGLGIELEVAARIARERDPDGWARVQLSPHVEIIVQPEAWESPGD